MTIKNQHPGTTKPQRKRKTSRILIILINKIHHNFRHHVLFLRAALGYHQCQGHQRVVIQKARAVGTVEDAVVLQEPQEQERCDAFVAVAERMVLDRQVKQIGRFLLDARVKVVAAEGLVNRTHRTFERLVLLVGEQLAAAELVAQYQQYRHRIFIRRMKRFLGRSSRHFQLLVIVAVERIETVSIVRNHAQQPDRLGFRHLLCRQNFGKQTNGLL